VVNLIRHETSMKAVSSYEGGVFLNLHQGGISACLQTSLDMSLCVGSLERKAIDLFLQGLAAIHRRESGSDRGVVIFECDGDGQQGYKGWVSSRFEFILGGWIEPALDDPIGVDESQCAAR
jgi:hypothetical protein